MSTIPTIVVTPSAAANAYARVDRGDAGADGTGAAGATFGATLERAVQGAISSSHAAEGKAVDAISGSAGSLTDVVMALSRAELTLQTATVIRDRVVQAYQDIIRMPI